MQAILRFAILTGAGCLLFIGTVNARSVSWKKLQKEVILTWKDPVVPPPATLKETHTSAPDGSAESVIFGDLDSALDATNPTPATYKIAAVDIPIEIPTGRTIRGFTTDIRFFVAKDPGARIVIFADAGGDSQRIEFKSNDQFQADDQQQTITLKSKKQKLAGNALYSARILILLERASPSPAATVQVDSLDIIPDVR